MRRRRQIVLAVGCAALTSPLMLWALTRSHDMPKDMAQYFVGLIYRGAAWSPERTPESEALQKAHLERIGELAKSGKMVLAGPFGDDGDLRGLFFYDVATIEEARALAESDPAVQAQRLRVEIHPWWGTTALRDVVKPKS